MPREEKQKLLIISGWSVRPSFIQTFYGALLESYDAQVIRLDARHGIDAFLERLLPKVSEYTVLCGWSLGGIVAVKLAHALERANRGYAKLVTFMSSNAFVRSENAPYGMKPELFAEFQALAADSEGLVKRFSFLMAKGSENERIALKSLRSAYIESLEEVEARLPTLEWLKTFDISSELALLKQPASLVFGQNDALISSRQVEHMLQSFPSHQYFCLPNCGHVPALNQLDIVISGLCETQDDFEVKVS